MSWRALKEVRVVRQHPRLASLSGSDGQIACRSPRGGSRTCRKNVSAPSAPFPRVFLCLSLAHGLRLPPLPPLPLACASVSPLHRVSLDQSRHAPYLLGDECLLPPLLTLVVTDGVRMFRSLRQQAPHVTPVHRRCARHTRRTTRRRATCTIP